MPHRPEDDYKPIFGGENFGGEGGPVDWLHPGGEFAGIGSREYQRPDDRILEDIHVRLAQHGLIDASDIQVTVRRGEVMLTGIVRDHGMKEMAENVARSVWGVKDVRNQIHPVFGHRAA